MHLLKTLWIIAAVGVLVGTIMSSTDRIQVRAAARSGADDSAPDPLSLVGAKVYQTNCAACHGDNRQGHPPMFPSLVGVGTRLTTGQITATIRNGKGSMPPFAKLSDTDLNALIHYLTTDKSAATPPASPPPA